MKIHGCKQGSSEWVGLHIGRPSVSKLPRILTPARLEYSKGARAYIAELICERMLGRPLDWGQEYDTIWTDRGTNMEAEARRWYSLYRDTDIEEVGFIATEVVRTDKDGEPVTSEAGLVTDTFGGSPDGLVGDDGLVEIKCRSAVHHARCITGADEIAGRLQTQGYLYITGREWIDVVAYNPDLPKKISRQYREPDVQDMIEAQLQRFFRELALAERKLADLGDVIEEDESLAWDLNASLEAEATPV